MAHLIDKDAVVAEINRVLNSYDPNEITSGRYALVSLRNYIDTLEVKEMDLENIIREEYLKRRCYGGKENMLVILNEPQFNNIAKHFFELGMQVSNKAQKG